MCALLDHRAVVQGGALDGRQTDHVVLGSFIARNPFTAACTKFSKFGGAQAVGTPLASRGERILFLRDAGAARTGEGSISSSRRATAGVRLSIGLDVGPLVGLYAVGVTAARTDPPESRCANLGVSLDDVCRATGYSP